MPQHESEPSSAGGLPAGQAAREETGITDPPAALRSRNPLAWFRFFGPGAIVASVTVGSGEIVFPSRGGALFGYELLWIYPAVALLKWGMAYASMRHIILSGAHPMQRWTHLPGPRGWLPLAIVAVSVLCLPLWYSWLSGILGTHSAQVSGVADHCFWATTWTLVAIALLWRGGYHFLEKAQLLILAIMLLAVFVAVFFVQPDWLAALKGFLLPHALHYPDWAFQVVPKLRERSEWVEVLVYVSVIGGGAEDYLAYVAFLREKRWGRSHLPAIAGNQLREVAARSNHPGRIWIRAALIDTVTSFVCVVLIAVAFTLMGALILQPQRLVPDGLELVSYQAAFLTGLAGWLKPLYDLAIFLAFFGILLGGAGDGLPALGFLCGQSARPAPTGEPPAAAGRRHRLDAHTGPDHPLDPPLAAANRGGGAGVRSAGPGYAGRDLHQLRGQLLLFRQHLGRPQVSSPPATRSRFTPGRQPGGRQRFPVHRRQGHGKLPGGAGLRVPHPPAGRLHAGGPENAVPV